MSAVANILESRSLVGPMLPYEAIMTAIKEEAYNITTYSLAYQEPALRQAFRFQPGQFNMFYLPGIGEVPISISSDPAAPEALGHTIRFAGNVTQAISHLKPGDVVGLRGPYGSAWPLDKAQGHDLVIVPGGIGLAPLRPVLYAIIHQRANFGRVILLYGARTPMDLIYKDELSQWEAYDIQVQITVDRADETWQGHVGVVPMLFYRIRLEPKRTMVLTCGPEIMMRFVVFESLARRVPKDHIFLSLERNMKCGIGFCGHCQHGPFFVCKDGPVFQYTQIERFFGKEEF